MKNATGGIYHILNRGVDKRKIFLDNGDYLRFIHDLFEFNDEDKVLNVGHFFSQNQYIDVRRQYIGGRPHKRRKMLVEISAFCLMPNHYHLLLQPIVPGGISLFMKKLNGGYAKYFNFKYERAGTLFQSRYKSILVKRDAHFIHIPYYIHANPLDLIEPRWREKNVKDYKKAFRFLENYRWSSHPDYLGKEKFPSVTQRRLLLDFFGGASAYRRSFANWLKNLDLAATGHLTLEQ